MTDLHNWSLPVLVLGVHGTGFFYYWYFDQDCLGRVTKTFLGDGHYEGRGEVLRNELAQAPQ